MHNETDREKDFIDKVFQKISDKMQFGKPENWQQRNFENLSLQIEEKTGISLSVSTLKRLSKKKFQKLPQKNTLNALAQFLDYKDWFDFKLGNPVFPAKKEEKQNIQKTFRFGKNAVFVPMAAIVVVIVALLVFNSHPAQSYAEVQFSSRKNVSQGVPNTVIFDYDISMYDFDSAFIQQSWDVRRRAEIKKNEKYSTSVYYFPGYHRAKLLINDRLVKEIPVYITTDGWLKTIQNPENEIIPIYVNENCIENGQLYIPPKLIENYNIDLSANNHFTSFYYVNEDFSGDSDNFIFTTRIKNNLNEGARVCQFSEISILGENGRHAIQLCSPGCIGSISQKFGNEYISGQNNDLSEFGTNLNEWIDLKMEFRNSVATIYLNEKEIYKMSYINSNGPIKGVFYRFAGSGAIDYARLYNLKHEQVFSENFE